MNNVVSFLHTIDKNLCHKENVHEVFLTDCLYNDKEDYYILGAVKPRSHSYYGERNHDEIFLLECCRQSIPCISHKFQNIPFEHKFIFSSIEFVNLTHGIDKLKNYFLRAVISQQEYDKSGSLIAQSFFVTITDGNQDIFHSKMFVKYIKKTIYNKIRKSSSRDRVFTRAQPLTQFCLNALGIEDDKNILISNLEETEHGIKTRLNVNLSNASLIEHRHDHFSAVILIDAIVQSSICYLSNIFNGSQWRLKAIQSKYNRFVEIIGITMIETYSNTGVNYSDEIKLEAKVIQFGDVSAEFSLVFISEHY
ncbi:hypothetical protein M5U04_02300 [Xenorhabdus sp. XENO-1]|uniref:AfsA-related hotdog domain-containing protein n=1 Tax=Xenorhabdus bovienii TaxID=40576 RepID=UPI0020CA3D71|nr:AfsA-related hotdog domain-containing protein [Xenorhabdus bovienii]MCP9266960.1 hypothetical protein [Xenorhabdus bovienii subsp. africana]